MDLSNPAALWLLVVLGIFLLLPRVQRPGLRRAVSNLYMWRAAESPSAEPRIKPPIFSWLMLLQALVLLLLIIAIAQPAVLRSARDIAVVIDVSASMGAEHEHRSRLDLARDRALALIDELPGSSRVHLFAAGPTLRDLGVHGARDRTVRAQLDRLRAGAGTSSMQSALREIRAAEEVRVFTDQPRTGEATRWTRVGSAADNVAITAFSGRPLRDSALDAELLVEVQNFGGVPRNVPLLIRHGPTMIHRETIAVPAHGSYGVVHAVSEPAGVYSARIEVDDALAIDNERFTIVSKAARTTVSDATRRHYFLDQALAVNPSIEVRKIDPAALPESPGVVVCEECEDRAATAAGVLMIVRPGEPTRAPLRKAPLRHPVTEGLDLTEVYGTIDAAATAPAGSTVLLEAGNVPVVVAADRAGRRVVYLQIDVDAPATGLDIAFPTLIANAIGWIARPGEVATAVEAGAPMIWRTAPAGAAVVTPSGAELAIKRSPAGFAFTETDEAGVYMLRGHGGTVPAFVVSPASSESDLSVMQPDEIETAHSGRNGRTRAELATMLIVAGLILAALDWHIHWQTGMA